MNVTLTYLVRNGDGKLIAQFIDYREAEAYAAARPNRTVSERIAPADWQLYEKPTLSKPMVSE